MYRSIASKTLTLVVALAAVATAQADVTRIEPIQPARR